MAIINQATKELQVKIVYYGAAQKITQHVVELLDVFLEQLWERGHVMRIAAWVGR